MDKFYTVDEVASKLNLHPRTVRRKIGQGEIEAVKVGKQYRISPKQMNLICGVKNIDTPEIATSVSSIVEVAHITEQQAKEINSKITTVFLSGSFKGNIHCSFNTDMKKLKIFIDCDMEMTPEIFSVLKVHIQSIKKELSDGKNL
jgi:excisionase family DNA binding protein